MPGLGQRVSRAVLVLGLPLALSSAGPGSAEAATGASSTTGFPRTQRFHTRPDLHPPLVGVTTGPAPGPDDIFLTPMDAPQAGPLILDRWGRVVWFHPLSQGQATNFQVQSYRGQPVLTWWQGQELHSGADVIMDSSYRIVAALHAGHGYQADLHEFQITPQGTALIDCVVPASANLLSVGGPIDGAVLDNVIQELDIGTGRVLWEWDALAHVPVSDSHAPYRGGYYDYFHLNSVQRLSGGDLVVSARNTWAVYEVSRQTGKVIWSLGGKHSNFTLGPGARFEWQHDARMHGHRLSLFDDGSDGPNQEEPQSSAKVLSLDRANMTASLADRYTHRPRLLTTQSGSVQILSDRDVFVGWGSEPAFSEYTPGGRELFNATFPVGIQSYRAYRFPWSGHPLTRPGLAVHAGSPGAVKAYASWNGATQVAAWQLRGGRRPRALRSVGPRVPWRNFETAITLNTRPRYLQVQALARNGRVLGTSKAISS